MVNSKKKMNKSTVAIVVLALLLVLSLVLTATGAWFTDSKNSVDSTKFNFGTVVAKVTPGEDGAYAVYRANGTDKVTGKVMPDDKIKINLGVEKDAGSEDFYFTVAIKLVSFKKGDKDLLIDDTTKAAAENVKDALEKGNNNIYATAAVNGVNTYASTFEVSLDGNAFTNEFQGATIEVSYEVRAIQVANLTVNDAKTMLTTGWNNGVPTKTVEAGN